MLLLQYLGRHLSTNIIVFAGFVTVSVLGFMAREKGMTVDEVATQGKMYYYLSKTGPLYVVEFYCV
jgi:hypothetical protein